MIEVALGSLCDDDVALLIEALKHYDNAKASGQIASYFELRLALAEKAAA